ncbi:MAG: hypothetical protein JXQ96_07180 [Cyclobacteriaceae bacterium]
MRSTSSRILKLTLVFLSASIVICCSGSDDPVDDTPDTQGNCLANGADATAFKTGNHITHIPKEDIEAGVQKDYVLLGEPDHTHNFSISAAQFEKLKSNQIITIRNVGHTVTVTCK